MASGIILATYDLSMGVYSVVIPRQPLFFGIRLVLVHDEKTFYYKADPRCFKDLPDYFSTWIAGEMAARHDMEIASLHVKGSSWDVINKWIVENMNKHIAESVNAWSVFRSAYIDNIENQLSPRFAYSNAVQETQKALTEYNNTEALNKFREKVAHAGHDIDKVVSALRDETTEAIYRPVNYLTYIIQIEKVRATIADFPGHAASLADEEELLLCAIENDDILKTQMERGE